MYSQITWNAKISEVVPTVKLDGRYANPEWREKYVLKLSLKVTSLLRQWTVDFFCKTEK